MARGNIIPLLIAVILFSAIAAGGVSFIGGLNDNYGDQLDTSTFNSSFGNISLNTIQDTTGDMNKSVDPGDSNSFSLSEATGIGWIWKKITAFIGQVKAVGTVATQSVTSANQGGVLNGMLPGWFMGSIVLIITIVIIGAIISMILRKDV